MKCRIPARINTNDYFSYLVSLMFSLSLYVSILPYLYVSLPFRDPNSKNLSCIYFLGEEIDFHSKL